MPHLLSGIYSAISSGLLTFPSDTVHSPIRSAQLSFVRLPALISPGTGGKGSKIASIVRITLSLLKISTYGDCSTINPSTSEAERSEVHSRLETLIAPRSDLIYHIARVSSLIVSKVRNITAVWDGLYRYFPSLRSRVNFSIGNI